MDENFPSTFNEYFVPVDVTPKSNFIITFVLYVTTCVSVFV